MGKRSRSLNTISFKGLVDNSYSFLGIETNVKVLPDPQID